VFKKTPQDYYSVFDTGYMTFLNQALWKLFIDEKRITGRADEFNVQLTSRETAVLKLIVRAGWCTNKGYWQKVVSIPISKDDALTYLMEELPKWVLKKTLEE